MRILITAGPTREYFDKVRYLTNASTGQMGYALAASAQARGHEVVLVSGPVHLPSPAGCEVIRVESTEEMRQAAVREYARCDGVIATAAVCDYTPRERVDGKIAKTGGPLILELVETPDILAELGASKGKRWAVGFALEAASGYEHALGKMREKNCDAIVLNGPNAIGSPDNEINLLDRTGKVALHFAGKKQNVAEAIMEWIDREFSAFQQ